jgi:hypothetical protein
MLVKNLPYNQLFSTLFIRMLFDALAGIYFLKQFNFNGLLSILKAHYSFYSNFRKFYNKRNTNQTSNYFKQKSIVWEYYIKKNKIFKA